MLNCITAEILCNIAITLSLLKSTGSELAATTLSLLSILVEQRTLMLHVQYQDYYDYSFKILF